MFLKILFNRCSSKHIQFYSIFSDVEKVQNPEEDLKENIEARTRKGNGFLKPKVRTVSTSSVGSADTEGQTSTKTSTSDDAQPKQLKFQGSFKKPSTSPKTSVSSAGTVVLKKPKAKPKEAPSGLSLAGVIAAKAIAKNVKPVTLEPVSKANSMAQNMAKKKPIKPKMDLAKALSMMGFGTARNLDPSGSKNARMELNASLTRKMNDFEVKRKKLIELDKTKGILESQKTLAKDKLRDEIRTLHEAYQFLARKYIRDEEKMAEKMNGKTVDIEVSELDLIDDLHLVNNFSDNEDEDNFDVFNQKKPANGYIDNLRIKADRKKTV